MKINLIVIIALLGIILLLPTALADVVNMEINVNGTSNLNITVDADDTLAREMIGDLQEDVYGPEQSDPKDKILQIIEDKIEDQGSDGTSTQSTDGSDDFGEIGDICADFADYLDALSSYPPEEFIQEMKALGYDDESHINMIWNMCQNDYISSQETSWSTDHSGIDSETVAQLIGRAVDWLLGKNPTPSKNQEMVGRKLDSYFASDRDVYYLNSKLTELQLRVEAMERTLEQTQAAAYCQGKIGLMLDYNMRWVRCGDTTYHNHLTDPTTGEDMIIGITPIENGVSKTEASEETEESQETNETVIGFDGVNGNTIECSDVGKPKNSVNFCTSYVENYWCGFTDKDDWYRASCIRAV
jgi:hypothetical protein